MCLFIVYLKFSAILCLWKVLFICVCLSACLLIIWRINFIIYFELYTVTARNVYANKFEFCIIRQDSGRIVTLSITEHTYRVAQKTCTLFLYALTSYTLPSSNIDRFSNVFHYLNQANICNYTVTIDPTTPQVCRYTTLWNVNVLKATTANMTKTIFVTTHCKKLTTGNNVFIVSVII